jgi:beta-glucanase (GH16 family)
MIAIIILLAATLAGGIHTSPTPAAPKWKLTWSDEFNGPAGTVPDPKKWTYDRGGNGWGNNELEFYTDSRTNSYMDGHGHLVIEAKQEHRGNREYTSARMKTEGLFSQTYGKFEARIQIPYGQGIWPAFWTLGENIGTVGWPACGELDIMEVIGKEPHTNHGSAHNPGFDLTKSIETTDGKDLHEQFHTYSIEWQPDQIRWYMDGRLYSTLNRSDVTAGKPWPYDKPQFIILNLAVGGNWPGPPNAETTFPQKMLVDYVRVYKQE